VQYPDEKLVLPPLYRGALAFHPDVCISCDMCVRACPSDCISLEAARNEATGKKDLHWYQIDFAKCNFCRLCEEICPTKPKAVHHTPDYELTFRDRSEFLVRWTPEAPQPKASEPGQIWSRFLTRGQKIVDRQGKVPASSTPSKPVA
jgi:formate hydrogenlyase subunit 6/NADH:ubiquinone oxidoreductase subunit I